MTTRITRLYLVLATGLLALTAQAAIDGITNTVINLTATSGHIITPDGGSYYFWGYAHGLNAAQYPGPTIILNQGDTVQINLQNALPVPTSLVFPGQTGVVATGGVPGLLTREVTGPVMTVTYTFTASQPGTYLYNSGTQPELQVEMGLLGAIIVRPAATTQAYNHVATVFDDEFLFLLTEMDPRFHDLVEQGRMAEVDTTTFFPAYWFINGRCGPDTLAEANVAWLPNQPYNCAPMMFPGQKILMRLIGAGRDLHPFHFHGNNAWVIARDGRMLESVPSSSGPDLAESDFTITVHPGGTADALFTWTGEKLGWDIYGHMPGDPLMPYEYAPDHGKQIPVTIPGSQDLAYGEHFGGSPFLGTPGYIPPGTLNLNAGGAYMYMWHSHTEKEICNNNVFPGGMMTMMMIMAPEPMMP
ncbi:MAG: multicopper oxidase domain-containing protein [bacterium]|nr:multicopper oxidase domain-containing protein [bacterium]